eukprot:7654245-Pyramimonas_sp.AAC.1
MSEPVEILLSDASRHSGRGRVPVKASGEASSQTAIIFSATTAASLPAALAPLSSSTSSGATMGFLLVAPAGPPAK